MLIWVIGKKRTVNKHRMKFRGSMKPVECQRCHKPTNATIMSMFNTEEICMDCKTAERQRPDYTDAVKADEAAIRAGNTNFKGVGL